MVIVTGGAGFIGSNLIRGLNQFGIDRILVVDDGIEERQAANLRGLQYSDYISKEELLQRLPDLERPVAIFHQGACVDTTGRDRDYMLGNNVEYSRRLLEYCVTAGVPLLYASSAAVYGDGGSGFREEPACEHALNLYAYSKLLFDMHVRETLRGGEAVVVGLRYFNVYGPGERHKGRMASVALHLFDQVRAHNRMRLFEGSDRYRRDFIHVDDVVAVNLHFFETRTSGIYNCGTGTARSFLAVARAVQSANGGGEIDYVEFPSDLAGQYQEFTEADLTALRAARYDRDFVALEDGIARYYAACAGDGILPET